MDGHTVPITMCGTESTDGTRVKESEESETVEREGSTLTKKALAEGDLPDIVDLVMVL